MKKKLSVRKKTTIYIKYGFHIWLILIIANLFLLYSLRSFIQTRQIINSHAQTLNPSIKPSASLTSGISGANSQTSPPVSQYVSPSPEGPVLDLSFSIPSIGSGSSNFKPIHKTRIVTVFLYSTSVNSEDPAVTPVYTIQGQAYYDGNPNSPTYTSYINHFFDLGATIANGTYQIAIGSQYTLKSLVKTNPTDIVGTPYSFQAAENQSSSSVPHQILLPGNIVSAPDADTLSIADYNAFVSCFGQTADSPTCPNVQAADLNDDGVVNGTDYIYLLDSFKTLLSEGFPVPTIPPPTPTLPFHIQITSTAELNTPIPLPTRRIIKPPVPVVAKPVLVKKSGGGVSGFLIFIIIILLLALLYFFVKPFKNIVNSVFRMLPAFSKVQTPENPPAAVQTQQTAPMPPPQAPVPQQESPAPVQVEPVAQSPVPPPVATQTGLIEKEYYVKKITFDPQTNITFLTLTGEEGEITGRFNGQLQIPEGFAQIKGEIKQENGSNYLEVADAVAEA